MKYVIDFHYNRQIQLTANTVLPEHLERADLLIIELLIGPLYLNVLCRKPD